MRNWRSLWRSVLPPHVLEELEVWLGVLAGLGALLLLYASLAGDPARAADWPRDVGASELAQPLSNRASASSAASGGTAVARPWPWTDTLPFARLTLPGGREPLAVLAGASGRNLALAPALMDGSAPPGTPGVSVIAGRRDTHFRALRELALGDLLVLERADGARFTYEVVALDVVDSARAELRVDADESLVALVTCWPFDPVTVGGQWRYVVTARQRF